MSVNSKMTAIADAIREKTGGTEKLGLDAMAENIPAVFSAGEQAEADRWGAEYYKASGFFGNGTKRLEVQVPFKPDVFLIQSRSPYPRATGYVFELLLADLRSCSRYAGRLDYVANPNQSSNALLTTASVATVVSYKDGVLAFEHGASSLSTTVWPENVRYDVTAVRFPGKTARELVTEQVSGLPDTPPANAVALEYNGAKIAEHFTDEEWAALIATKPNWTFSMI